LAKLPHIQQKLDKNMTAYKHLNKYSNMQWRNKEGGKWGRTPWTKVWCVHQHTLQ